MLHDDRTWHLTRILTDYLKSPSLRHVRDPHSLGKLAREILTYVDRQGSVWSKWEGEREPWAQKALPCWIPMDELRDFLNRLPGQRLTTTDVAARLDAMEHEEYVDERIEALREGCLVVYEREKAAGTEMPAIIWAVANYAHAEADRYHAAQQESHKQRIEQAKEDAEQRLLSGADCRWTQPRKSKDWYCRVNGRLYRLSPLPDKRLRLCRVKVVSSDEQGSELGRYQSRGDATKAVSEMAYKPEARW
jgi:hypothetical protein